MAAKPSRRLVIDASVARASGDKDATFPTAKRCRDFLLATLKICHCVVLTKEITAEWNRHQSGFARRWRVQMEARKKVIRVKPVSDEAFRNAIIEIVEADKHRDAIIKDLHLIEAAREADNVVIALDEVVRNLFHTAAQQVGPLRTILWVNPDIPLEEPITWLEKKAKMEKHRCLGFVSDV